MSETHPLRLTADPDLAARELRRLRRGGWRSPVDHVLVEALRSVLILVPAGLWVAGGISTESLLGFLAGYLAVRWFDKYLKPRMLHRLGPVEWRKKRSVEAELEFSASGLRSIAPAQDIRLGWSTVPVTKVGDGMVFRIGPELSIPVTDKILPDDWPMSRFEAAIMDWKTQAAQD
ncbi:hypothetical protein K3X13_15160 (plasmid) [Aliiroseovarius crassostreae]|uniref:hypothetical protein n=1 Tax=Aliiroseovarius crassostreae TaxID=154981 RepID=UPI0021FB99A9|nr:hypothetical protein [Aliiroseovarius crassostreae]UWP94015.1 hypothetical protein K3X13_15160 [Aliiroseovarius crassostreae]UWQ00350.1 hypothetical protein K3X53_15240 [Aliiroseovarius crassostreae]